MKTNRKKIQLTAGSVFLSMMSLLASSNEKGIEYYRAELYDAAKIYFENQIKRNDGISLAESYYYLGECYAATEKLDSASYFYQKAIQTNPEYPYSYIGEGKLSLMKENITSANDLFKKAIGFAKKDPAIHTAVAEAYIGVKQYEKAEEVLEKARSIKKNFSGIYVAEGDMLMSQGKTGEACARYENAILFDAKDKVAYLKLARVYKTINPDLALENLNRLLTIDPEYIPAFAELGDTYYQKNNYNKAIEAYNKFIEIPGISIQQQINYAFLLYYTKDYTKSLAEVNAALAKDPKNLVMRRLQIYNNYELEAYSLGLEVAENFIKTVPENDLIVLDYVYYGRLLEKNNATKKAIEAFNKAISKDKDGKQTDIYKDLAIAYEKDEDFNNSIIFYKKFIETDKNATLLDIYNFGRTCYNAGNQKNETQSVADSLTRRNYLLLADSIFTQVIERSPDSYLGYIWRAHTNASLDPEVTLGLAKPFYEQAANKLEAVAEGASRNRNLIDCYRYLGYYYYLQKDYCTCKGYFQKILALDPENAVAKQLLDDDAIKKIKCN